MSVWIQLEHHLQRIALEVKTVFDYLCIKSMKKSYYTFCKTMNDHNVLSDIQIYYQIKANLYKYPVKVNINYSVNIQA